MWRFHRKREESAADSTVATRAIDDSTVVTTDDSTVASTDDSTYSEIV